MTTAIRLKKSSVAGKAPLPDDLLHGELAINFADGKLFYKNSSNEIKFFVDSDAISGILANVVETSGNITLTGTLGGEPPIVDTDFTTKLYVDAAIASGAGAFPIGDYETLDTPIQEDAFNVPIGYALYDKRNTPRGLLATVDLGAF